MNKNIQNKAKFLIPYLAGEVADFGSEDVNWDESLHKHLETFLGRKIIRVDKFGSPDIKIDFDKPFKINRKFDTILVSEVIEHLKRPYDFLLNLKSLLKENGRIIITTPNAQSLSEIQSTLSSWHHKKQYTEHLYSWGKHNMFTLLEEANYDIQEFRYISFYWNRNYLFKLLAWIFPFLRPNLFIIAGVKNVYR